MSGDCSHLVDSKGIQHHLESNIEFTIGRSLINSLTIEDLGISRSHCRFKQVDGLWTIIDESSNGTFINEKRIPSKEPVFLSNGDVIRLTNTVCFKFEAASGAVDEIDVQMAAVADQIETEIQNNVTKASTGECSQESESSKMMREFESDLQCSICMELFVKAQILNCSHTFCKSCIEIWKKKNKVCPICREKIKTMTPTIIMDNMVSRIIESSSEEVQQQRKVLIEDREKSQKVKKGKQEGAKRSTRNNRNDTIVVISDISDDESGSDYDMSGLLTSPFYDDDLSDSFDDADAEYVPGNAGAYYGGYGSCYNCRARGHWANGCPYR